MLGPTAENLAAEHYKQIGYELVERNFFPRFGKRIGEIDIICKTDYVLVFVEVKARRSISFGTAYEAVDQSKAAKLVKTAKLYMQLHPEFDTLQPRIDLAVVDVDNARQPVIIIENAVEDQS